jgi:hypothetical protein
MHLVADPHDHLLIGERLDGEAGPNVGPRSDGDGSGVEQLGPRCLDEGAPAERRELQREWIAGSNRQGVVASAFESLEMRLQPPPDSWTHERSLGFVNGNDVESSQRGEWIRSSVA